MANFFDSVQKAPKWLVISLAAVVLGVIGYGFYFLAFGMNKPKEEAPETIIVDMPDAKEEKYTSSALQEFERAKINQRNNVADYWDSLEEGDASSGESSTEIVVQDLDPAIYSDYERLQIQNGIKTKAQIDAEHAEAEARRKELERAYETAGGSGYTAQKSRPMTQAQQDSIYMDRLERAYKIAAKYSAQPAPEPAAEAQTSKTAEEEERKLDLEEETAALPTDSFADDGIITSLDEPSDDGVVHYGNGVKVKPVKATFLKNEKLVSGNRVILRLMQDMTLADGTLIPANTHITGTCAIGRRMKINVSMLHYAGRMFPVDISVYDNDGTEGIYCPLVEESSTAKKKAKQVAQGVISSAGTLAGTLVTGNPILGSMASNGIRSATSSIGSDGTVAVNVSAGYEFYVYENVKDEKGKK